MKHTCVLFSRNTVDSREEYDFSASFDLRGFVLRAL